MGTGRVSPMRGRRRCAETAELCRIRKDSEDPYEIKIGAVLRERRLQLGLSQTVVAEAIGVTFQQLQKQERGVNRTSVGRFIKLCRVLTIAPEALIAKAIADEPPLNYTWQAMKLEREMDGLHLDDIAMLRDLARRLQRVRQGTAA